MSALGKALAHPLIGGGPRNDREIRPGDLLAGGAVDDNWLDLCAGPPVDQLH